MDREGRIGVGSLAEVNAQLAQKANIAQEALTTPTLLNSYTIPSGHVFGYRKTSIGALSMYGRLTMPGASGAVAFNLPSGYRPAHNIMLIISTNDAALTDTIKILINSTGSVQFYGRTDATISINITIGLGV